MKQRKTTVGLRILTGAFLSIITLFVFASKHAVISQATDEAAVRDALLRSASSFATNDIAEATKVWANDESLTIFESGHANYGWADYRDHHLVPENG